MQTVTTLDQLLPLVAQAKTCREFGAIVLASCPPKLKGPLSKQARDYFGWDYNDGLVAYWVSPSSHGETRKAQMAAYNTVWLAVPENKQRRRASIDAWKESNPSYHTEYYQDRRANDPAFKIAGLLRTRLYNAVKTGGAGKSASTLKLVGCTLTKLMEHLEVQFTEGMTWANKGEWEIDHIKPCASFDLTDPAQQRACFHWTNLQPLWAADNKAKSNRLDWSPSAQIEPRVGPTASNL